MPWSLDLLLLPSCVDLGGPPLSGLVWTLLLLFLWYCYHVGSDPSPCSDNSTCSTGTHPSRCSTAGPGYSPTKAFPTITVKKEEENKGKSYFQGWNHASSPTVVARSRKLYTALQVYVKRYSWAGMGRIHKGLRIQVWQVKLWRLVKRFICTLYNIIWFKWSNAMLRLFSCAYKHLFIFGVVTSSVGVSDPYSSWCCLEKGCDMLPCGFLWSLP